jgi:hypothetical protein
MVVGGNGSVGIEEGGSCNAREPSFYMTMWYMMILRLVLFLGRIFGAPRHLREWLSSPRRRC